MIRRWLIGLALGAALALPATTRADDFPSRQITIVVGLAPGGTVGAAAVQNAVPDGYTPALNMKQN